MSSLTDLELLREYASQGSEDAFATLVSRYARLVYSAAFRQCGHVQDAEEITQAVFVILARKAGDLRQDTVLPGWLLRTTRFVAMNARRRQLHRLQLEHDAMNDNDAETNTAWQRMAPVLDEALERLSVKDRDAVVLRYFEQRSFKEIAHFTAATEGGAQKRVTRAVEKLRIQFQRRGLILSSVTILTALTANAVQAAPAQLTATVVAAVTSGTALTGSVAALVKVGLAAFKAARLKAIGLGSGAVAFFVPLIWLAAAKLLSQDPFANVSVKRIATSADGTKLVAAGSGVGLIYASANSGVDWHATSAPRGSWHALASSADGTILLAAGSDFGGLTNGSGTATGATSARIYTSTNSGASWAQASRMPTNVSWTCAAASADGQKLVVAAELGGIYVSTNAGTTWNLSSAPNRRWNSVASSADGNRLVALAATGGAFTRDMSATGNLYTTDETGFAPGDETNLLYVTVKGGIYISGDAGLTWTRTSAPQDLWWWSIACSEDGNNIVATTTITGTNMINSQTNPDGTTSVAISHSLTGGGSIYSSTNAGASWMVTSAPSIHWVCLTASADASTLVAAGGSTSPAASTSVICISRDVGVTWTTTSAPGANWNCVAVSADGNKIFAGMNSGGIKLFER